MAKILNYFSFTENISIMAGRFTSYLSTLFNREILYDYSVLRITERNGKFRLISSARDKIHFQYDSYFYFIRKKASDSAVFKQVFLDREYEPLVKILLNNDIKTIIDAGANVGYASMFLHKHFPEAKIFAIEPSEANRRILSDNVNGNNLNKVVKILPFGLWSDDKTLGGIDNFRDAKDWSYRVSDSIDGQIQGRTLESIMRENHITAIDILKVDIEGAEKELFESPGIENILLVTKCIAIETHEEIGYDKLLMITRTLVAAGFEIFTIKECTFGFNRNIMHA